METEEARQLQEGFLVGLSDHFDLFLPAFNKFLYCSRPGGWILSSL